jgi:PIN domain nuclease of toxin-antitoxin system
VFQPLLLDTHCWIWLQDGLRDRFTKDAQTAIDTAIKERQLLVSVISAWEVGLLHSKGRIELLLDCEAWVNLALSTPGLRLAALTPGIAVQSTCLPGDFHGDPADRILVATAKAEGARLLTKDRQILEYGRKNRVNVLSA